MKVYLILDKYSEYGIIDVFETYLAAQNHIESLSDYDGFIIEEWDVRS